MKLLVWRKKWIAAFANSLFDRCRQIGKYLNIKFTTKYAVPDQIKLRILVLSMRRSHRGRSRIFLRRGAPLRNDVTHR